MTLAELIEHAKRLSLEEQRELMAQLNASMQQAHSDTAPHSILELAGLGAELWADVDAQTYIDRLRDEWDEPK